MPKLKTLGPKVNTLDTRRAEPVAKRQVIGYALQRRREEIAWQAGYECQKCGLLTSLQIGEADHIVPLHMGGSDTIDNMQWLCKPCHEAKTEEEAKGRGG